MPVDEIATGAGVGGIAWAAAQSYLSTMTQTIGNTAFAALGGVLGVVVLWRKYRQRRRETDNED